VWCGNNENTAGHPLYEQILPAVCAELDPTRPYRPASPYSTRAGAAPAEGGPNHGSSNIMGSETVGDAHGPMTFFGFENGKWEASRENFDPRNQLKYCPRFVTEAYSAMCPPLPESFERFMAEEDRWPLNDMWAYRNPDNPWIAGNLGLNYNEAMLRKVELFYGKPSSAAEFLKHWALFTSEYMRIGVEHLRSRKFHNAGILWWMYNECWPGIDFGIIDYYLVPKVNYYFLKRAQAPVAVTCIGYEREPRVSVVNDTLAEFCGEVRIVHVRLDGETLGAWQADVRVPRNGGVLVRAFEGNDLAVTDPAREALVATLERDGALVSQSTHFFVDAGAVRFPEPTLAWHVERSTSSGAYDVTVETDVYARCVKLEIPGAYAQAVPLFYGDNYFDLAPGQSRTVRVGAPEDVIDRLRVFPYHAW